MLALFGLLSGILPTLAAFPYVRDILKSKTKPHRTSFLIWAVLGVIAFITQLAKGATWSLLLPAGDTLAVLLIFILSFKHGIGGFSKTDKGALLLAGLGLILWYITKEPLTALLITIFVDAIGTFITFKKTIQEPHTETFSSWLLACLGGLFAALAVGRISFSLLVYPVYIFLANGAVDAAIIIGKKSKPTK